MGTVLYPKDSDLAVSLPDADAQAGLMAGTHLVPMVDNAGETVGLSQQDATRALADGSHRQPNEAEMQHMLKTSKYGQGSQRFTADVEAAGRGIVPGSDALLRLGGVNPEEIQARKEANSETGVIEGAGFLASALTGKGIAAGLTKAGNLTEKTAAKVAEHVIENKVGQAALTGAARLAAESVIYQANDELNSAIRNDPNSSAEAALAHIGTAALFGGVGGAALFGAPALWKATIGPKADEALSGFVSRAKFYLENPNPVESATSELTDLHSKTHAAQFEPYGEGDRKSVV